MNRALVVVVALILATSLPAQVKVLAGGAEGDRTCPLTLEVPFRAFPNHRVVFETRGLAGYVCDGVWVDHLRIEKRPRKNLDPELRFTVTAQPETDQNRLMVLLMELRNDHGPLVFGERRGEAKLSDKLIARLPGDFQKELRLAGTPGTTRVCLLLKAEQKKTRPGKLTCYVRDEELLRLIGGPNPRLVVMMGVASG